MAIAKHAKVIIGANFGDEGKGVVTDAISDSDTTVVRFNGGSQAGHTVTLPDGRMHVFHHFGAGSFAGAATFLSQFFICNPLAYRSELAELVQKGVKPRVFIDCTASLTTPFDMMINQMVEEHRGAGRHGSCGMGIHETIVRSNRHGLIRIGDPVDAAMLTVIRDRWVPARLAELDIVTSEIWRRRLTDDAIVADYLDALEIMRASSTLTAIGWRGQPGAGEKWVFEGAQGLLLDRDNVEFFPHLTPSKTGLHNAALIAANVGIVSLDAIYVSRPYVSRHGAGPLLHEERHIQFPDPTNQPNPWQGRIRYGTIDIDRLSRTIGGDCCPERSLKVDKTLWITCLDQFEHEIPCYADDNKTSVNKSNFVAALRKKSGVHDIISWAGPTRLGRA